MKYLQVGTISEGTTRDDDLLRAFADTLESCIDANPGSLDDGERNAMREARRVAGDLENGSEVYSPDQVREQADALITELLDYLQGFAPSYTYVGTLEGDGACFGCWVDHESIHESLMSGDLETVSDTAQLETLEALPHGEALHVTDHGNMTLYYRDRFGQWREAWSVV